LNAELQHSNRVLTAGSFDEAIQELYPRVANPLTGRQTVDSKVEITSPQPQFFGSAAELGRCLSHLQRTAFETVDPYVIGPIFVRPGKLVQFKHASMTGYIYLNTLNCSFAELLAAPGTNVCVILPMADICHPVTGKVDT